MLGEPLYTYLLYVYPFRYRHAVLETGKESLTACLVDLALEWGYLLPIEHQ